MLQLFKGPLSEIPVARPGNQTGAIINLVDRIIAAKQLERSFDTSALEMKIDELVFALYGLTNEEKAIVKNAVK